MIKIACGERDRRPSREIVAQKPVRGHANGAPHSTSTARPHSAETNVICLPLGLQLGKLGNEVEEELVRLTAARERKGRGSLMTSTAGPAISGDYGFRDRPTHLNPNGPCFREGE